MPYRLLLALSLMLAFAAPAAAQVYKCQSGAQIVYSDAPCKSGEQTVTDIQTHLPAGTNTPSLTQRMDEAVRSAIAAGDLQRAQALATTQEHRSWIAAAQQHSSTVPLGRTEADLSAERGDTQACQQAIRSLELEASSPLSEPEALRAKRSIMHAACGIREPAEVNNYEAPTAIIYPVPRRPYYRPGLPHPHRPGWSGRPPHKPIKAEPPAVSVIVGPAEK